EAGHVIADSLRQPAGRDRRGEAAARGAGRAVRRHQEVIGTVEIPGAQEPSAAPRPALRRGAFTLERRDARPNEGGAGLDGAAQEEGVKIRSAVDVERIAERDVRLPPRG